MPLKRLPPAPVLSGEAGQKQKAPGASDRLNWYGYRDRRPRAAEGHVHRPWKKSDIGDLAGKPMNSLVDEILAPVDRTFSNAKWFITRLCRPMRPKMVRQAARRSRVRSKS